MIDFYNRSSAAEGRFGIERPSIRRRMAVARLRADQVQSLSKWARTACSSSTRILSMFVRYPGGPSVGLVQVAADANTASAMYPDHRSIRQMRPRIAKASTARCSAPTRSRLPKARAFGRHLVRKPIVADAEAEPGGPLNAFEIMKAFIEAGAAGVHFEDQLASKKKCGHPAARLIPTAAHIRNLDCRAVAADVMGVPTLIVARTDAEAAKLLTSDIDERDQPFVDRDAGRTVEGFYQVKNASRPGRPRHRLRALLRPGSDGDRQAGSRPGYRSSPKRCRRRIGQEAGL